MKVNIKRLTGIAKLPYKKHSSDLGYDCYASSIKDLGDGRIEYGLGIAVQHTSKVKDNPKGFIIIPRSSIHKTGLILSNSEGLIDENYTGEVKAVFYNIVKELPNYEVGDRICQLLMVAQPKLEFEEVYQLKDTDRGSGGYGSTGNK